MSPEEKRWLFRGASALDIAPETATVSLMRGITLNGGEISILKTIGLSGGQVAGKQIAERMEDMESAEFLDTLLGLMTMGYVLSTKVNIRTLEAVESSSFRVNPAFARELRDALYPSRNRPEKAPRRQRRG